MRKLRYCFLLCGLVFAATLQVLQAQTFVVLHRFTGGGDGATPVAGVSIDLAGNLYGTTSGGNRIYGTVYKLKQSGTLQTLHTFRAGQNDGNSPRGRVTLASDGSLFGTTWAGPGTGCGGSGCGMVFRLRLPPTIPTTVQWEWNLTIIKPLTGDIGANPQGDLTFDVLGNIFGTTVHGGTHGAGAVYTLTRTPNGYIPANLYSPPYYGDGPWLYGGVVFDNSGKLYGTFERDGLFQYGTLYELSPDFPSWDESSVHEFDFTHDGGYPIGGLIADADGNLYGTTSYGGPAGQGTVFKVNTSGAYTVLYSFPGKGDGCGPEDKLAFGPDGDLYGTTYCGGAHGYGSIFKVSPTGQFTSLYDFTGEADGRWPLSTVVFDALGSLYGTASAGGNFACNFGCGVVWEITP